MAIRSISIKPIELITAAIIHSQPRTAAPIIRIPTTHVSQRAAPLVELSIIIRESLGHR